MDTFTKEVHNAIDEYCLDKDDSLCALLHKQVNKPHSQKKEWAKFEEWLTSYFIKPMKIQFSDGTRIDTEVDVSVEKVLADGRVRDKGYYQLVEDEMRAEGEQNWYDEQNSHNEG